MRFGEERYQATIYFTRHGKPCRVSYALPRVKGESYIEEHFLDDALGFPDDVDDLAQQIREDYPDIEILYTSRTDLPFRNESGGEPVSRERFEEIWDYELKILGSDVLPHIEDVYLRDLPVDLSGKDEVACLSGWFHYPILIEDCKQEASASLARLKTLISEMGTDKDPRLFRDIIEEAYYEQVQRQRLAIYERRRENWRVIRWGATTALGLVLAFWSGLQIWDWFFRTMGD